MDNATFERISDDLGITLRGDKVTKLENPHSYVVYKEKDHFYKYLREYFNKGHSLCYPFNAMSKECMVSVFEDENDWIAQPKLYGCRVLLLCLPGYGCRIYSRKLDEETGFGVDLTHKLIWFLSLKENINHTPMLIDGMIVSDRLKSRNLKDRYRGEEDNGISYILSLEKEESERVQRKYMALRFVGLDVLMFNDQDLRPFPLRHRMGVLDDIRSYSNIGRIKTVAMSKKRFYVSCVDDGYEGIVLKNLTRPYTSHRDPSCMVKVKRNCSSFRDDIDLFVSDIRQGHLILSSYFLTHKKTCEEVEVGRCTLPDLDKQDITFFEKVLGKTIPSLDVIGQVVSAKVRNFNPVTRKFGSVKVNWRKGFRGDKHRLDCVLTSDLGGEKFLNKLLGSK